MKRQRILKFDASEVQGEGAWVECSLRTWGQMRASDEDRKQKGDPFERTGVELIANVREWNWQDDDGQPLAQPLDDPEVFGCLSEPEILFLLKCIRGLQEPEVKNS